ncbi:MAG: hypothetical protein AAGE80_12480 [Pseudomonadota bacterium]
MRVGFLLNHYAPHQVPHVAPLAFALSRFRQNWTVELLCSTEAERVFAEDIGGGYRGHSARVRMLETPPLTRLIDPLVRQVAFYRKRSVQSANIGIFAEFDALIVPEMTSLALRERPEMQGTKLIFTGHGAGDGYNQQVGMFDPRIDQFDLVMLPGTRILRELNALGRFQTTPYAIAGYPKLELNSARPNLFDNDRPTVLYNPTQNRLATSWHKFGTDVLDFFYASQDYNLIFAPHVLLFRRAWSRGARLPRRYRSTETVRIDKGSRASVDMSYLNAADIYLGDLSSQVYEFINQPRPCVFLDPIGVDHRSDPAFRSWSFGPVVRDIGDLKKALATSREQFESFHPLQQAARDENFAQAPQPASVRGAEIIAGFLETGEVAEQWR